MAVFVVGCNKTSTLGATSDSMTGGKEFYVSQPTMINFDAALIDIFSIGCYQSVILTKDKRLFVSGEAKYLTGDTSGQIYEDFTEISLTNEKIIGVACGQTLTVYLTESGLVLYAHYKAPGELVKIKLPKRAVSVHCGVFHGGMIDEDGKIYLLDNIDPYKTPECFSLDEAAIQLVCCDGYSLALTEDGRVFGNQRLNNGSKQFSIVQSLKNEFVVRICGYSDSAIALTDDGKAFGYGKNSFGELGNGTFNEIYDGFVRINFFENLKIKDVFITNHTFFLTDNDMLFACGHSTFDRLFGAVSSENVCKPMQVFVPWKPKSIIVGNQASAIFFDKSEISNIEKIPKRGNWASIKAADQDIKIETLKETVSEQQKLNSYLMQKVNEQQEINQRLTDQIEELQNALKKTNEQQSLMAQEINDKIMNLYSAMGGNGVFSHSDSSEFSKEANQ